MFLFSSHTSRVIQCCQIDITYIPRVSPFSTFPPSPSPPCYPSSLRDKGIRGSGGVRGTPARASKEEDVGGGGRVFLCCGNYVVCYRKKQFGYFVRVMELSGCWNKGECMCVCVCVWVCVCVCPFVCAPVTRTPCPSLTLQVIVIEVFVCNVETEWWWWWSLWW